MGGLKNYEDERVKTQTDEKHITDIFGFSPKFF